MSDYTWTWASDWGRLSRLRRPPPPLLFSAWRPAILWPPAAVLDGDHGEDGPRTRHGLQTLPIGAVRVQSEQPGILSQDTHLLAAFLKNKNSWNYKVYSVLIVIECFSYSLNLLTVTWLLNVASNLYLFNMFIIYCYSYLSIILQYLGAFIGPVVCQIVISLCTWKYRCYKIT